MADFTRTPAAKARTLSRRANLRLKGYRYPMYADFDEVPADEPVTRQIDAWVLLQAWQQAERD